MRAVSDIPQIVWLAAAFAAGIGLAQVVPLSPGPLVLVLVGAAAIWRALPRILHPAGRTLGAVVLFAALGLSHAALGAHEVPRWPERFDGRVVSARGVVTSPPESTLRGWRAVIRVQFVAPAAAAFDGAGRRWGGRARQPPGVVRGPEPDLPISGRVRILGRGAPPQVPAGSLVAVHGWFRAGRAAGNPGERSERDALRRRGLAGVLTASPGGMQVERRAGWSVRGLIAELRRRMVAGALRGLPGPQGGLLVSLLLGIDTHLDPAVAQQFSRAGLVHLMVVSGAQVAIVAGVVAWGARLARLSVTAAAVATGGGVAVFAAMIDWAPSIGRAVIMAAVALGAVLLGRQRDSAAALAVAALALLAATPQTLFDVGFQLSFAATWGLLFVAPVLQRRLSWLGRHLSEALGVTLGAQIAVAPLLAAHFQTVAVAGIIANILVIPVIAVLVPAGFAIIPLVVLIPRVGVTLLVVLKPALAAIMWVGAKFGDLSWATVPTPPVSGVTGAVLMGLLGTAVATWSGRRPVSVARQIGVAALCVAVLGLWYGRASLPPRDLMVTVLDVGQGDAILVQSPAGRVALIDGGGEIGAERTGWDVGLMRVVPALRRAGVRRVDLVMLSHPHEDHVGGLPAVLENFTVGLVLDPGVPHPSPSYMRLLRLVEAGRIPYRTARAGVVVDLGGGVALTVVYPPEPIPLVGGDPVHAGAVISRLTYGATAMLLTGDAEGPAEHYLLERGATLASQVLKVGHHGSRTSTTPAFLSAVRPVYAVISLGADNSFGHPHRVTLATLEAASVAVFRTDLVGAVRLASDGRSWNVETARRRSDAGVR